MEINKKTENIGIVTGIILVIIILLFGAYYFVNQRIEKSRQFQATINQEIGTSTLASTSSDNILDIEKDVNSLNVDSLGSGINSL